MAGNDHGLRDKFGAGADLKRALTVAVKVVDDVIASEMDQLGLTTGESDVLTVLSLDDNGAAPGDMAEWLRVTTAGMTGRLHSLERKGLIERNPHPTDGRRVNVQLTPAGSALAATVLETKNRALVELVVDQIGLEETLALIGGLDALIEATDNATTT